MAVIVPARNEGHQVARCLRSLLAQDWPHLRVVCVDDRSDDDTAAQTSAIDDARLTVVHGVELPPGWLGKNHANVQGVAQAGDPEWLLFTDADTFHEPGALPSALAAAREHRADLYSLFTNTLAVTFWEKALMTHVLAAVVGAFPLRMVNDPRSKLAIANGQFILIRRAVYEAVGGHAAIRDRVADDLELARLTKRRGFRLWAQNGRALVSVRMYTRFPEIWWGFVKNATAGAGGPLQALGGAAMIAVTTLPFLVWPWLHGPLRALAVSVCLVALVQRAVVFALLFPVSPAWALSLPLAAVLFCGILLHSAARQLRGKGPLWKGREYPHGR